MSGRVVLVTGGGRGIGAVSLTELMLVHLVAATSPKRTDVMPPTPEPSSVTNVPTGPPAGVNPVTCGCSRTVPTVMYVPPGDVTDSLPSTAVAGTTAWMLVPERTVKVA